MVQYKKFCLEELFSFETGNVDLQQKDINGKGCYFINSGLSNAGIKGKTDREAKVFPSNTITVDFWGNAFYRDFEYKLATHNHIFSLSGDVIRNREVGLYLVSQMTYFRKLFSFNEMATIKKLKGLSIELPIDSNGDFDWVYMESFIKDIEQRYIGRLEQEAALLPNYYLAVSGLDCYDLTNDDRQVLDYQPVYKDFVIGDLFDKAKTGSIFDSSEKKQNVSTVQDSEFCIPLTNAKHGDNGIQFYGRKDEWETVEKSICVVTNGAVATGDVYPEPQETGVLWDAYLLKLKDVDVDSRVLCYLASALEKSIKPRYDRDNKAYWKQVSKDCVCLPVDLSDEPNWGYMKSYIKVIEKLVIKNVVDEKEKLITKTKAMVNCAQ